MILIVINFINGNKIFKLFSTFFYAIFKERISNIYKHLKIGLPLSLTTLLLLLFCSSPFPKNNHYGRFLIIFQIDYFLFGK